MVEVKKGISKNSFVSIVLAWNAISTYVQVALQVSPELLILIATLGNVVIAWLGVESGNVEPREDSEA